MSCKRKSDWSCVDEVCELFEPTHDVGPRRAGEQYQLGFAAEIDDNRPRLRRSGNGRVRLGDFFQHDMAIDTAKAERVDAGPARMVLGRMDPSAAGRVDVERRAGEIGMGLFAVQTGGKILFESTRRF